MTTKEKEAAIALYGAHLVNRAVASLPVVTPSPSTGLQLLRQEVVHYHARPPLDLCHKVTPLDWWKTHAEIYPQLAQLAKQFLCITATSVPCERVFSKGGWLVSKRRSSLTGNAVSLLMFLACNAHHQ
jgi:hypothetical protein